MGSVKGGNMKQLTPESNALVAEGISFILSQWTGLDLALAYRSYDRASLRKVEQISADIYSWLTQSKEPLYIDDLEELLRQNMELFFDTILDDGSEEEVAEDLVYMYEDCLQGKYETIEKLRRPSNRAEVLSQSLQAVKEDEDDDDDDAGGLIDEAMDMLVDEQEERRTVEALANVDEGNGVSGALVDSTSMEMLVDDRKGRETVETEDGWCVVATKRKTRRSSGLKQC